MFEDHPDQAARRAQLDAMLQALEDQAETAAELVTSSHDPATHTEHFVALFLRNVDASLALAKAHLQRLANPTMTRRTR